LTQSDTEVILKAFRCWGKDALLKLSGMFAIAIWDSVQRKLLIARDQLGIKPLYYADLDGELVFASEIKSLFCHPKLKRDLKPDIVAAYLGYNNTFGNASFWSGVKRCLPGEGLEWEEGKLKSFKFFDIASLEVDPFKGDIREAGCQYRELLTNSINAHLIADVPISAYLSSGIDSASISLLVKNNRATPLSAYTGYFKDYECGWFDERPGARMISSYAGLNHYECPITYEDFNRRFDDVCYHLDEPMLGSSALPQFIVAEQVSKRFKVVLTGHGGDDLFAGYPVFKAAFLRQYGLSLSALRCLSVTGKDEFIRLAYFLGNGIFDRILARGQLRMLSNSGLKALSGNELIASLKSHNGIEGILEKVQPFLSKPDLQGITRWYLATYLTTLLTQEDKISMAHGLESRVPICSIPLVKFSLSLPDHLKLYGGRLKAVPLSGMRGILPARIHNSPKRGFPTPIVSWLHRGVIHSWESVWNMDLPSPLKGLLNREGVLSAFSAFRRYQFRLPNAYAVAHRLVALQMLHRCASTLNRIPVVDPYTGDLSADLKGPLVLKRDALNLANGK
ncbi:MAG: asparagine synthase (glutamine-hydrolyzing), partial [Candidatus Omnitrophica bacterium]|nr:asparagine synthase (glutamine-hydrolyzing) [Candidatus Omnitrophota bacterium]